MQGMYWKFLRNPAELVYLDTTNIPVIEEVCHQSPAAATDENVVALQADIEWTDAVRTPKNVREQIDSLALVHGPK